MTAFDHSVLRQPRWILAIVVGALLVVSFVFLGAWQLQRLDERQGMNAEIEEKRHIEAESLSGLGARYGLVPGEITNRAALVEGMYRTDLEFFSIGRTYGDLTGTLVATPLELATGELLIVIRGLVPLDAPGPPAEGYEPPPGLVMVAGVVGNGEEPLRIGEPDPAGGELRSLSRIDLTYVDTWIDGDVLPVSLTLVSQEPSNSGLAPVPVPVVELTEGRHLGYAVQWFAFAIIVAVGVGYLIWRAGTQDEDDVTATSGTEMDRDRLH